MVEPQPLLRGRTTLPGYVIVPSVALLLIVAGCYAIMVRVLPGWFDGLLDVGVYQMGGAALLHGESIYDATLVGDDLQFTYPPFAALLFVPLSVLSRQQAGLVMLIGNMFAVAVTVWTVLGRRGVTRDLGRVAATIAAVAIAMLLEPFTTGAALGQVNALIMAVIVVDLARPDGARFKGIGVGLVVGIKVIPGIFILYLLVTRRWKAAGTAMAAFLATVAVSALVAPGDTWRYWTDALFDTGRVTGAIGPSLTANQALLGAVLRTGGNSVVWAVMALVVLAGGMALAVRAYRLGDELVAVFTVAVTALLVAPITWTHYWIWAVVGLVLGVDAISRVPVRLRTAAAAVPALLLLATLSWPTSYGFTPGQDEPKFLAPGGIWVYAGSPEGWHGPKWILANWYVLMAFAILAAIYLWVRHLSRSPDGEPFDDGPRVKRLDDQGFVGVSGSS